MAQEKQSFMKGAAVLTASTLIVKVLGLLFSIPLANLISTEAMSSFYVAYNIFSIFLMISTAGLPIAVSSMVGTAYSQNRRKDADAVFSVAFWLFFILGVLGFIAMFFFSAQFAALMGFPKADHAIKALAPTVFFISVMSALRGYFQGRSNMVPTAASQTIEAVTKVVVGIGLAMLILSVGGSDDSAVVGAVAGVSVSAGLGTLYLALYRLRQKRRDRNLPDSGSLEESRRAMLINLVRFSVPITIGSCFLTLLDAVDTAVLSDRLQAALSYTQLQVDDMNGLLGHARKFFDLPGAFVIPISTSLLPVLSGAVASNDKKAIDSISSSSLRITFLISIPSSVGMCIFARPICGLLLAGNPDAAAGTAPLLAMLSVAIAFNSVMYTGNAILQSFGRTTIPVVNMAIGGVAKIALSYVLIGIPSIGVMGSAISTVVSYFLMMMLNFIALRKSLPDMDSVIKTTLPILLSSAIMAVLSYAAYYGINLVLPESLAVLPAIIFAVAVYAVAIVVFKAVTYDDVIMLPKGELLCRLLHIKKPQNT